MEFEETGVQQSSDGIEYTHQQAEQSEQQSVHPDMAVLQNRETGMQRSVFDQLEANRMREEEEKLEMEKASRGQAKLDKDEAKFLDGVEAQQRAQHAAALAEFEGARAEFMRAQQQGVKVRSGADVLKSLSVGVGLDLGDEDAPSIEPHAGTEVGTTAGDKRHRSLIENPTAVAQIPKSQSSPKPKRRRQATGSEEPADDKALPQLPMPRRSGMVRLKRAVEVLGGASSSSSSSRRVSSGPIPAMADASGSRGEPSTMPTPQAEPEPEPASKRRRTGPSDSEPVQGAVRSQASAADGRAEAEQDKGQGEGGRGGMLAEYASSSSDEDEDEGEG